MQRLCRWMCFCSTQREGDVRLRRQQALSPLLEKMVKKEDKQSAKRPAKVYHTAAAVEASPLVGEGPTHDPHLKVGENLPKPARYFEGSQTAIFLACNHTAH